MRTILLLALSGVFGCQLVFDFDGTTPGDPLPDGDIGKPCTSDPECDGLICAEDRCVECTIDRADACTGTEPVCGNDSACHACVAHAECASEACMPDGSCASEVDVAYVAMNGSGIDCTRAAPCTFVGAIASMRSTIKFAAGVVVETVAPAIINQDVTIVAERGARLDRTLDGTLLAVTGNSAVTIVDLAFTGQTGGSDFSISLSAGGGQPKLTLTRVTITGGQGIAIQSSAGSLTVSQSTISGNQGGGIFVVGGEFAITNNFIFRNGNVDTAAFGGVHLGVANAGTNRFEFNTVVDNRATANAGGVVCTVQDFLGPNNIIARNTVDANLVQTSGSCMYPSSRVQDNVTGLDFLQAEEAPFDYHLTSTSTGAIDAATTNSPITVDVDGDGRVGAKDIGADELQP